MIDMWVTCPRCSDAPKKSTFARTCYLCNNSGRVTRLIASTWRPLPGERFNVDWSKFPLGKVFDREIAKQVGCSVTTVLHVRRSLGIPAFRPPSDCPK